VSESPLTEASRRTPVPAPRKKRRKAALRVPDGRRVEARILREAERELLQLAGSTPSAEQLTWIHKAASLAVVIHQLTRGACTEDLLPPEQVRLLLSATEAHTRLCDRIKAGAPLRKHEPLARPEPPEMADLHSLFEDGDG
jgi:hypothetical protein